MLRLCQDTDCHDIWIINKEEMGYHVSFETAKRQLEKVLRDNSQKVYVYEVDGKVVGYVHACNHDLLYAPPMKNVLGIAVLKEYQHNGIGGLLLLMVEDWATDTGAAGVRLNTGLHREVAHMFYEAWGYEHSRDQRRYVKMF